MATIEPWELEQYSKEMNSSEERVDRKTLYDKASQGRDRLQQKTLESVLKWIKHRANEGSFKLVIKCDRPNVDWFKIIDDLEDLEFDVSYTPKYFLFGKVTRLTIKWD